MRYAIRRLVHQPGFSLVVILTLALGIGANTAIFSLVNAVLLRSSHDHPERLVTLDHYYGLNNLQAGFALPNYADVRARTRLLDEVGVFTSSAATIRGSGGAEVIHSALVTDGTLRALGVQPLFGRLFRRDEPAPNAPRVVIISQDLHKRRFGSDRNIVGKKVVLGGEPFEVIGVMPRGFYSLFNRRVEVWAPAVFKQEQYGDDARTNEFLFSGAPAAGHSVDQATREVTAFADGLKHDHPSSRRTGRLRPDVQ
jgi:putative ABC transport system permease protein